MSLLISAVLEFTLMGPLFYTCYLLYGHWRRRGTNTEKVLFLEALIVVLVYPFMLIPYVTGVQFTGHFLTSTSTPTTYWGSRY